jgi:hypothetical protein
MAGALSVLERPIPSGGEWSDMVRLGREGEPSAEVPNLAQWVLSDDEEAPPLVTAPVAATRSGETGAVAEAVRTSGAGMLFAVRSVGGSSAGRSDTGAERASRHVD